MSWPDHPPTKAQEEILAQLCWNRKMNYGSFRMQEKHVVHLFRDNLIDVEFQPIETGGTGSGIFDTNILWSGHEIWVEFKAEGRPLRASQKAWAIRRMRNGGRIWIINMNSDPEAIQLWSPGGAILREQYPQVPEWEFRPPYDWGQIHRRLFLNH